MANSNNILDGLRDKHIKLNENGIMYKTTGSTLSSELRDMLETAGLRGLQDVYLLPTWNGKDSNSMTHIKNLECSLIFEIGAPNSDKSITWNSNGNSNNNKTGILRCTDIMPYNTSNGVRGKKYIYDEKFKGIIKSLTGSNDIYIAQPSTVGGGVARNIGCIVVDFYLVMAMALKISNNSSYNFTIVDAFPTADGDDFVILIEKYIDASGNRTSRNIDMSSIFRRR